MMKIPIKNKGCVISLILYKRGHEFFLSAVHWLQIPKGRIAMNKMVEHAIKVLTEDKDMIQMFKDMEVLQKELEVLFKQMENLKKQNK